MMAKVLEPLPPMWETHMEFQAIGFGMAQSPSLQGSTPTDEKTSFSFISTLFVTLPLT